MVRGMIRCRGNATDMSLARKHDLMKRYCIMICGDYKSVSYCVFSSLFAPDTLEAFWSCGMLGRLSTAWLALSFQLVELPEGSQ
jgi:hypothetical protein